MMSATLAEGSTVAPVQEQNECYCPRCGALLARRAGNGVLRVTGGGLEVLIWPPNAVVRVCNGRYRGGRCDRPVRLVASALVEAVRHGVA